MKAKGKSKTAKGKNVSKGIVNFKSEKSRLITLKHIP
jgi:hypothetical protein